MEHLLNCHGEWAYLLSSIPFIGVAITYIKTIIGGRSVRAAAEEDQDHRSAR